MNVDSASTSSSGPTANQRKERGAIAAQACDTCRSRKQKCDESRPKCGLCQRMKLECRYREPQPTKKDKTLVEILDRLKSLETKVDRLPTSQSPLPTGFGPVQPSPTSQPSFSTEVDDPTTFSSTPLSTSQGQPSTQASPSGPPSNRRYRHASAAHKILTWPAIQQVLLQAQPSNIGDLTILEKEGSAFLVTIQQGAPDLPLDDVLQVHPFVGMQSQAARNAGGTRVIFPELTQDVMHRLATAYFDSFNYLYPFMDRQNFISDTLTRVQSEGFDGDIDSVIALLVFALGELAIEATRGEPIEVFNGRRSGIRGGTADSPPGIGLFNEARKRMGFVMAKCDLENVQVLSLAALYYESTFRHLEFWRLSVSASLACQVLVTCYPVLWESPRGDLIKRMFWHCAIMETGLYLELDIAPSGVVTLADTVGFPSFNSPFCEDDHRGNQSSHFEQHYISQVALRRLCSDIHRTIGESSSTTDIEPPSNDGYSGPSTSSLKQLASQLSQWRGMLPRELQWAEDDPASFPTPQPVGMSARGFNQAIDPNLSAPADQHTLFTADLDSEPVQYPYVYDIQVALLRTRYYYAKYMVYRPFLYKALHFPGQISQEDAEGVAECLHACLRWPLALSPTSRHKRLVPYLFCWSQNFLGILIIIHMTKHNELLHTIRNRLCGGRFEAEIDVTVETMVDWIRDLKSSDPTAQWCWNVLQAIYTVKG